MNLKASIIILNWNGGKNTITEIEWLECIKNGMYDIKQSKVNGLRVNGKYLNMKCINIYICAASINPMRVEKWHD